MIYETAHEQRVRLNMQEQTRREEERLRILATPLWGTPAVVPVVETAPPDPDAPAADDLPIDAWMRHENERVAKREAEKLKAETNRYGKVSVGHRTWISTKP